MISVNIFSGFLVSEDCTKQNGTSKQQLTTKWKRDRRTRLPEYSRKSDPKIPEVFNQQENGENGEEKCMNGESIENKDIPIDMTVRNRGQPPSYDQTISNPGYRSSYRPSVIQNSVPPRDEIPSGKRIFQSCKNFASLIAISIRNAVIVIKLD